MNKDNKKTNSNAIIYGVVQSFYCYEELDEKLPKCKKQCVVCRSTQIYMENNKMVELGTPIGKFIIDNAKGTQTKNGVYYHYSDVVRLLKDYKEQLRLNSVGLRSEQLPLNKTFYNKAKTLDYIEFSKWINSVLR